MKKRIFIFLLSFPIFAQDNKTISLKEIIRLALKNSPTLQNLKYDLSIADVDYLKTQSKYETELNLTGDAQASNIKEADDNSSLVDKKTHDTASGKLEKTYKSGTTLGISTTTERKDDNKGENINFRDVNASPPIFTSDLKLKLKQNLLRNFFGVQDRNNDFVTKNEVEIKKLRIRQNIAENLSRILTSYWDYVVKDISVKTFEKLYENVNEIRKVVTNKNKIGLSKKYEINQWDALLLQAKNRIEEAKVEKLNLKRDLARQLNLDEKKITIHIESYSEKITIPSLEEDLKIAYKNRRDYQQLKIEQKKIIVLMENAKKRLLPTLEINGSVASKYQNYNSHSKNFSHISGFRYKEIQGGLQFVYPFENKKNRAELKEYQISKQKLDIDKKNLKEKIYNEIVDRREKVNIQYKIFKNAEKALFFSDKYNKGIVNAYNKGVSNSLQVKSSLDTSVQNNLNLTRFQIQYSIAIIQYYLAKNTFLKYFDTKEIDLY